MSEIANQGFENIYPKWVKPSFEVEKGEFERVLSGFLGKEVNLENLEWLRNLFNSAEIVELNDNKWAKLD